MAAMAAIVLVSRQDGLEEHDRSECVVDFLQCQDQQQLVAAGDGGQARGVLFALSSQKNMLSGR